MYTPSKTWKFLFLVAALLSLLASLAGGLAQAAPLPVPPDLPGEFGMQDDWEAFLKERMAAFGVPGAVMVMVRGEQTVFVQGYGYADLETRAPFDLQHTRLRAGSIAKTLTATAIFQLAEQGKLDLDADVNLYLQDFKVPDTYAEPVTARQLINMTAGFDTRNIGIRARRADELLPLGEYLSKRLPPRVLPPGTVRRYNDHEVALAGYLVEVVSGQPYEEYVREHIFAPLEMEASSVWLPDERLPLAARGYPVDGDAGDAYPLNYYYLNDAPGSGFNTSASDMAHYLSAHLNLGRYTRSDGLVVRLLEETTAREMQQTAFAYHPGMPGQANTFDEFFYNGHRYLRKQGGAPGMRNNLVLLPDQGLGFYLFYNSEGSALAREWEAEIASRYLNRPAATPAGVRLEAARESRAPASSQAVTDRTRLAGHYLEISDQTSTYTLVKAQALFDPDLWVTVTPNPDGSLQVWGRDYQPAGEGLFTNPVSGGLILFSGTAEAQPEAPAGLLFANRTAFQRQPAWRTPPFQLGLLGASVLLGLVGLAWLAWAILRRRAPGHRLAGILAGLNLASLVGLAAVLLPVATGGDIWQFSFEPSLALRVALALPLASLVLGAGLLARTWQEWRSPGFGWGVRLHRALVLAGTAGWLLFLQAWNLLGWRF